MSLLQREISKHDKLHSLEQVISQIPSRGTCDKLWAVFVTTIYPLVPVLHLPTFYRQYDDFWRSVEGYQQTGSLTGFLT